MPARRSGADQDFARLRRGVADRRAAVLHRMTAGRVAFIGGQCRICGDEMDRLGRDDQLLGGELNERCLDALAELGFAGEDRDLAVRIDADPGIEHRRFFETSRQLRSARRLGQEVARQQ